MSAALVLTVARHADGRWAVTRLRKDADGELTSQVTRAESWRTASAILQGWAAEASVLCEECAGAEREAQSHLCRECREEVEEEEREEERLLAAEWPEEMPF